MRIELQELRARTSGETFKQLEFASGVGGYGFDNYSAQKLPSIPLAIKAHESSPKPGIGSGGFFMTETEFKDGMSPLQNSRRDIDTD